MESAGENKNIREMYQGIRVCKTGFQARTNILRDKYGDVVADPKSILNRWTNTLVSYSKPMKERI